MRTSILFLGLIFAGALAGAAQDVDDYFPAQVGTTWEYELTLKRGEQAHAIRYATKAVRSETLEGVECVVFETTSGSKLLRTAWYEVAGSAVREWQTSARDGAVVQKLREVPPPPEGEEQAAPPSRGRLLFDSAQRQPGTTWSWTSAAGDAEGTITFLGPTELENPALGRVRCLQIEERGEFRRGGKTARQVRTLWFAPKLGLVREVSTITLPDGRETTSEATLLSKPKVDQ
ncbi:MAG: hypothetical protein R3F62_06240 [Planctomycetota bacterium]